MQNWRLSSVATKEEAQRELAARKELARRRQTGNLQGFINQEQVTPSLPPEVVTSGMFGFGDPATEAALQGASLGWSEEAGAGLKSIPEYIRAKLPGGSGATYPELYQANVGEMRRRLGEFEGANPKTALGLNIAGGLGTAGLGASKLLASPFAMANPIKTASLIGGAGGGLAGAGYAPTLEDVPAYAGTGAAFGTILPPALALTGKALAPIGGAIKGAFTAEAPKTTAARTIGKFQSQDAGSLQELAARMRIMGPESKLADVAGENLLGAARAVGQLSGTGKEMARKSFMSRQAGSFKRVMGSLKKMSGGDTDYFNNMKRIVTKNRKDAAPHYAQAEGQMVKYTDDLSELMTRPSVKAALTKGSRKAADEGVKIPKSLNVGDEIDFKTFDYMKRALDDKVGAAIRAGNNDEARVLTSLKRELLDIADDQIPAYKTARSIYSEGMGNVNAMEMGKRVLKDDFDEMADIVGTMSKTEKEGFINGALKTVRDKLMTGREDKNAATKLSTQLVRERLKTVFPDDESYKAFINQLDIEDDFARTYQTIYG
jgi:hypothetical protein